MFPKESIQAAIDASADKVIGGTLGWIRFSTTSLERFYQKIFQKS